MDSKGRRLRSVLAERCWDSAFHSGIVAVAARCGIAEASVRFRLPDLVERGYFQKDGE